MPRSMTAGMQTTVALEIAEFVMLVELDFQSTTYRFTTGAVPFTAPSGPLAGLTFAAVGGAMTFENLTESTDLSAPGVTLTMAGVDTTIIGYILTQQYLGRVAKVWLAHINMGAGTLVADPILLFSGYMNDGWSIKETRPASGGGTCTVSCRCTDRLAALEQRRGIQPNVGAHQAANPYAYGGDTFFSTVGQTMNYGTIRWSA